MQERTPGAPETKPRILLVDDEVSVLNGLRRQLCREFAITVAESATAALTELDTDKTFATVISDMRMPNMNGAEFLSIVRAKYPTTVRILLTGNTDAEAAISAINDGGIFQFLCKPCVPITLLGVLRSAVVQHERLIREQQSNWRMTASCTDFMSELIGATRPEVSRRVERVRQAAQRVHLDKPQEERNLVELAAAMYLSTYATLPSDLVDKISLDFSLENYDQHLHYRSLEQLRRRVDCLPKGTLIQSVLDELHGPPQPSDKTAWAVLATRTVLDYDALIEQGHSVGQAIEHMQRCDKGYDSSLLEQLADAGNDAPPDIIDLSLDDLEPGMRLGSHLIAQHGVLLIKAGEPITESMLARIRANRDKLGLDERIRVYRLNSEPTAS